MVGRKPREELDITIVELVDRSPFLGYKYIEDKINIRCEGLGLEKPSTRTVWIHMIDLCNRDVLYKNRDKYGGTHYSLKKEFKNSLYVWKKRSPTAYVETTLSQFSRFRFDDGKAIEIINDEFCGDK